MNVGQIIKDRYKILELLGEGGMAFVYKAEDRQLKRMVAIKTLKPNYVQQETFVERFKREAQTVANLNHPNIVQIFDWGIEDEPFFVMEYIEGNTLTSIIAKKKTISIGDILFIGAQVSDGLQAAHNRGLVHRDIKPGNIIFNPDNGEIKITDFGIAKISDDSRTRTGSVMGSPLYMSPEQLKGQKVTGATDTYSLGITLYKLVCGETPYQGDTLANLTYQILNKRPRSVREFNPELPNGVVRLINKAIQREPDKRFLSAATMAEALRRQASREAREEAS